MTPDPAGSLRDAATDHPAWLAELALAASWRLRIDQIVLKPNDPTGLDFAVIAELAAMMRKTTKDPDPVEVSPLACGHWLLEEGHHRLLGAVVAGRPDVLATLSADSRRRITARLTEPTTRGRPE